MINRTSTVLICCHLSVFSVVAPINYYNKSPPAANRCLMKNRNYFACHHCHLTHNDCFAHSCYMMRSDSIINNYWHLYTRDTRIRSNKSLFKLNYARCTYDVGDLILLENRPDWGTMVRRGLVEIVVIGPEVFLAAIRGQWTIIGTKLVD